jgi:hypothetical protein
MPAPLDLPTRRRFRRRPAPRHALPTPVRRPAKRNHGTLLGVVAILVITSGFVAGTTATYTASSTNSGNEFSAAALSGPSGLKATPSGSSVQLQWSDAVGWDNTDTGYRLSVADWQAAPSTVPTTCNTPSAFGTVGGASTSSYVDSTLASSPHTHFVDGRVWCYKAETIYPYPESSYPWVSQVGNPTTVVEVGHTLVGATALGDGDGILEGGTSTTDGPDAFEFYFNQAIDPGDYPTGYICADKSSDRILVGVNSTTGSASCPKTGGQADSVFSGFWLTGGTVSSTVRFRIGSATPIGCPVTAPPGCFRLRITIRQRTAGSNAVISGGPWTVRGTSNTNYLNTVGAARNFCQSGAATTISGLSTAFRYRANPSGGNCAVTLNGVF